ncbi:MAG: vWA domain-containing protein [Thiotrichales bacterium]
MSDFLLYWRAPWWLLLVFIPLIAGGAMRLLQRQSWNQLVDGDMIHWARATGGTDIQRFGRWLILFAWVMLGIALAGPRTPQHTPADVVPGKSQVVIILDRSASMEARDHSQSRFAQAQQLLNKWVEEIPGGAEIGLLIFAGREHLLMPPTSDQHLLKFFTQALQGFKPPVAGNALNRALEKTASSFTVNGGERYILLLTDGDLGEAAQASAYLAANNLANQSIHLVTVGLGDEEPVLVPAENGRPLMHGGQRVVSQRETKWLKQFTQRAGGIYFNYSDVVEHKLSQVLHLPASKIAVEDRLRVIWHEWFGIPLFLGALALFIALQLPGAKPHAKSSAVSLLIGFFAILSGCSSGQSPSWQAQGLAAIKSGDYAQAKSIYSAQSGYSARFGEGYACYRLEDYICAQAAFSRAAWDSSNERDRGRAVFNLGNTHFQLGEYAEASVLFAEAEALGVSRPEAELNREFSDALYASITRYEKDIAKALRRAAFRAQVGQVSREQMQNQLSIILNFPGRFETPPVLQSLSTDELSELLLRGVAVLDLDMGESVDQAKRWVKIESQEDTTGLAPLINTLMALETGLSAVPEQPRQMEGQRPW